MPSYERGDMKGSSDQLKSDSACLATPAASKGSSAVANVIISVCHGLTFIPLLVIIALQDVHLKLAIVMNTALCICLCVGNFCFHRMGVIKVYPKLLDTFLLAIYGSLIPVAYTQTAWLLQWLTVFHHGAVALFMWLSILVPCLKNFVLEGFHDCLPEAACSLRSTETAALHAAQGWAGALTIMALAALAPALSHRMHAADPVYIICDYVLGIVPLSAAAILHRWSKQQALQVAAKVNGTESGGSAATIALRAMAPAGEPETSSSSSNVESASCSNSSGSNLRDVEVGQKDVDKQQSEQDSKGKNLLFLWRAKFSGSRNG